MNTTPRLLILLSRSKPYPRNDVLVRAFRANFVVTTKEIETTVFDRMRAALHLVANGRNHDAVLLIHPAIRFAPFLFLVRPFVHAVIIGDAFLSEYDTLISDRKLASEKSLKAFYYRILDTLFVRSCDILLFETLEDREYFHRTCGIRPTTLSVVAPVSVDIEAFGKIMPRFPEGVSRKSGEKIVIFFGNYIPLQGAEYVVDAIEALKERKDIRFFMVGNGQTKDAVILHAKEKALENVTFIGRMDHEELMAFVKKADLALGIFGCSEKAQRLIPNKLLEAMALGVPVVTGRNAPSERNFKEGEHVRYARSGDGKDIARVIVEALAAPEECQKMGERGREVVERRFSLDSLTMGTIKEVADMVSKRYVRSSPVTEHGCPGGFSATNNTK